MSSLNIKVRSLGLSSILAFSLLLGLSACSDKSKEPPDDGEAVARAVKSPGCSASFVDCAMSVLDTSGLLPEEKASLSSCAFESATPQGSSADSFEVAKQAVKHSCH